MTTAAEPPPSLARLLALNRTVGIVLITVLFFGLGEELWSQFMPVYLQSEGKHLAKEAGQAAGAVTWSILWSIGVYACLRELFEGFCYIGGGQLTARLGDRGSLILFALLTISGYLLFLTVSSPAATILAALLIMGWEPLSTGVTFTTVGATVTPSGQGMAFALQSIQKRLPKILGPLLAGFVLGAAERILHSREEGRIAGMHWLVAVALLLSLVSLTIQLIWMPHRKVPPPGPPVLDILRQLHPTLRRLLVAEIFTRWCDWLVREFVVLYVLLVRGVSVEWVGVLLAVQNFTALLTYLPIGRMTRTVGLQPFIGVTFVFFALFPLVLAVIPSQWLVVAFIVYGLREIGEPARKALITSLMPEAVRARGVGLYWGVRSFAICSASLVGAVLWWTLGPEALLYTAFALGCVGAGVFYVFCHAPGRLEARKRSRIG
jgi:predicted MFS family arabinose efflux permease